MTDIDSGPIPGHVTEAELRSEIAETALIGAVAYQPDALAPVLAALPAEHFYSPHRAAVWAICRQLSADRVPVDPVTISRRLADASQWNPATHRVVHVEMTNAAPASHAAAHAATITDLARRRTLIRALTAARQVVNEHTGDASEILAAVRRQFDGLDEDGPARATTLTWPELVDEFELAHASQTDPGIPSPWWELDEILGGLHAGRMYTFGGRPGSGKALALDTPIATPEGWTTMGELKVGDRAFGADGIPTRVTHAFDVVHGRPCFEVVFSDGSTIVADADHQWLTEPRTFRKSATYHASATRTSPFSRDQRHRKIYPSVVTTTEIARTLCTNTKDRRPNHSIPVCQPLKLPSSRLPIDPYVLGVWLGDGHSAGHRFTTADPDVALAVEATGQSVVTHQTQYNYGLPGLAPKLRALNLINNKHIPARYLRASEQQRRSLLAGLLDTDGSANPRGSVEFGVTCRQLAEDARELILSLGYQTRITTKVVAGRTLESSIAYTMRFTPDDKVFRLARKLARQNVRRSDCRKRRRMIVDVRPVPSVPVRCISVDNADHLYLAGRSMIPTHNSTAALNIAQHAAIESGRKVLIFSKEMPTVDVTGRLLARGARVSIKAINRRNLMPEQMDAIRDYVKRAGQPDIRVNAAPCSLEGMKTIARAQHHRTGLDLLVVDYLQLVRAEQPGRTREQEVGRISSELKTLAMELGIVVVLPAQLNRGSEQRTDKRPTMADLRDSGQIEQDSDAVILLWHQLHDGQPSGEVTLIVDKNRHGPRAEIKLRWSGGHGSIG